MLCSAAIATSACEPKRIVTNLAPPAERLQCEPAGDRPTIPPELTIDWSGITTVQAAYEAHRAFVERLRTREGIVAFYLVEVEGKLFKCANNAAWLRQWYAETASD